MDDKVQVSKKALSCIIDVMIEHAVSENRYAQDYCTYCGTTYGNIKWIKGDLPHESDCPLLAVKQIQQEIEGSK